VSVLNEHFTLFVSIRESLVNQLPKLPRNLDFNCVCSIMAAKHAIDEVNFLKNILILVFLKWSSKAEKLCCWVAWKSIWWSSFSFWKVG